MAEGVTDAVQPRQVERDDHLQVIHDRIIGEITEDLQDDMERILVSARTVIFDKKTHKDIFEGMRDIEDPSDARKVALGVAAILTILNRNAKRKIPVELMVPAGVLVAVEVVKFMVEGGMVDENPEFTGNVVEELLAALMQKMGMGKGDPPPSDETRVPPQGPQNARIPPQGTSTQGPPQQGLPQGGLVGAPA